MLNIALFLIPLAFASVFGAPLLITKTAAELGVSGAFSDGLALVSMFAVPIILIDRAGSIMGTRA